MPDDKPQRAPAGATTPRPRRRLRRVLLVLVALFVLIIAGAPTILSLGVVRPYVLDAANARLPVQVEAEGWSLSWFGVQEIRGLSVRMPGGARVATVERAALDEGLFSILTDRSRLGPVRIEGAEAWTDSLKKAVEAFGPPLPAEGPAPAAPPSRPPAPSPRAPPEPSPAVPSAPPPALPLPVPGLVVPEAIEIHDLALHGGAATVRVVEAALQTAPETDILRVSLEIAHGTARGSVVVDAKLTGLSSGWRGPGTLGTEGTIKCTRLPVAALWAIAAELGVPMEGGGTLSADVAFSRSPAGDLAVRALCDATDLWATGRPLKGDRPALTSLYLEADAAYTGGVFSVKMFDLQTPVLAAQARGTFALAASEAEAPTGKGAADVRLEVAPIARMLPGTLGLHKDLVVESGSLQASLQAASDTEISRLKVTADLKDLRGRRGGKAIVLSPARLVADLERDRPAPGAGGLAPAPPWLAFAESLRVNVLEVTGAFGAVEASGRMEAFSLDGRFNLANATEETGRFVDLKGYGAAGTATVNLTSEGRLEAGLHLVLQSDVTDLVVHLGEGSRLREPRASLSATADLKFDDRRRLTGVTLSALNLDAATASLHAKGSARRPEGAWQFHATAGGSGTVANLGGFAGVLVPIVTNGEPPQGTATAAGAGWRQTVIDLARRASGAGGKPAEGRWTFSLEAGGSADLAVALKADAAVTGLVMPLPEHDAEPFRITTGTFKGDVLYHVGEPPRVTVNLLQAKVPGLSAVVQGPATLEVKGADSALDGTLRAAATVNLPTLSETLAPLDLLPEEPTFAGDVEVQLTVSPDAADRTSAKLAVVGHKFKMAWSDGRGFSDPQPHFSADATLSRDADGALTEIGVTNWSVGTIAGSLEGTAGATHQADRWRWRAGAAGEGAIRPLAQAVAKLLGEEPSPIRGLWKADGNYDSGARRLTLTASATSLTIPQQGDEPRPDFRLDDVRLQATASLAEDGLVRIDQADFSGPGVTARASGTVRLPSEADERVTADGTVTVNANLAEFARVLKPFGVLPEGARLAGTADFDGKVASNADGFAGQGTLDVADLDIELPESQTIIQEPKVHLPIAFAYETGKRRWDVASKDMTCETVSGTWRAAVTRTEGDSLLQTRCDLTFDAKRVRNVLGKRLSANVRLSGPWRVVGQVAGPLPPEGPWHRRMAGLAGEGSIRVDRFEYETLSGGDGEVHWKMADGQILLGANPDKPSRLALAGGTVNLGGRIDLGDRTPRLLVTERLLVIEGMPLGSEQVQDYLKYASPVLAASVSAKGDLSLAIDSLDIPLADDPNERDLPDDRKTPIARRVTATGAYRIDDFQTELLGPLGKIIQAAGGQAQTVVQPFGPVNVRMQGGILHVEEHDLRYTQDLSLRFGGTIGVDKRMNVIIGVPLTPEMLARYKISASVMPYLNDIVIAVPLTGTIDNPRIDEKAIAKRMAQIAIEVIKREALDRLGDWLKGTLKKD